MKFAHTLIYGITTTMLLYGCSTSTDASGKPQGTIKFNLEKSLEIDLPFEYEAGFNLTCQSYSRNDTDFLLLGDMMEARLIELDISHGIYVRSIPLSRIGSARYPVFTFHYLNKDTIVILPDISNEHGLYHDSLLYSINLNGRENQNYDLSDSPFIMSWMDRDSSKATFFHHFSPMKMQGRILYVNPLPLKSGMSEDDIRRYGVPQLGYFDLNGDSKLHFQSMPYQSSQEVDTQYYAHEQERLNICLRDQNTLMVSHANLPEIHLIEKNTGEHRSSVETGRFIPDPKSLSSITRQPSYNPNSTVFRNLIFDNTTNLTYRFATFPSEENLNPGDLSEFRSDYVWVGAYDEELNLIAQSLKPNWFKLHPEPIFIDGKCTTIAQGEDHTKVRIQFSSLDTVNLTNADFEELKDSLTSIRPDISIENINSLFGRLPIPSNSVVLTLSSRSCPYCLNYATQYFLTNLRKMEEQNIYLIASNESASSELKSVDSPNIIIVESGKLEDLLDLDITNPALMIWDGNQVARSRVLPPDQIKLIDQLLVEFQLELKE